MLYPKQCFGILQFYICLAVLYKIICLQFFICILLSALLFYVFVSLLSLSFMMFYCSELWERMLQKPLVPIACISGDCNQTWPRSGISVYAGFGIFRRLWQTRGLENKVQFWPILSCVIIRFLCLKSLSLKLMHVYTDDRRFFWLVFAFYFTSCYNSRMYYRNL